MALGADTSWEFTSRDLSLTTSTCGVGRRGSDLGSDTLASSPVLDPYTHPLPGQASQWL